MFDIRKKDAPKQYSELARETILAPSLQTFRTHWAQDPWIWARI